MIKRQNRGTIFYQPRFIPQPMLSIQRFALLALFVAIACTSSTPNFRTTIDLSGDWQFALDPQEIGVSEQWFSNDLDDSITLPGTMDLNQKGTVNSDTTTLHLNRLYTYEGSAWYRKTVEIPENMDGQHLELYLERTKSTWVWIDGTFIGSSHMLQSPHRYDVTEQLSPGEHTITLKIDNSRDLTPYRETHIFSDDTQTNWNGVIGEMYVQAMPKTFLKQVQVYPNVEEQSIDIHLKVENQLNWKEADFTLIVEQTTGGKTKRLPEKTVNASVENSMKLTYELGENVQFWDEYNQPLYTVTVVLKNGEINDSKTVPFGMRKFEAKGTQFAINGRITFLRGKHDAAIFPETGHTPTDIESWLRVFEIAKTWGINHYRFHSYTPPKAAFEAADLTGMYLQTELPFWGGLDVDSTMLMLRAEGLALLDEYANHPSFMLFSHGNEIWSGHENVEKNLLAFKAHDPRPLYAMGSNNNIGYVWPKEVADFFVGSRTPSDGDQQKTHLRLTHAFVDSEDGGILNTQTPSTNFDFNFPVSQMKIPTVTHEIGQYQIYPNYDEIEKYTGPVRAWNLEVFRENLREHGMLDQDSVFQKASGAWSALSYKAEMEAALRTEGLAGFQLLDLQDFSGQGTALVGILDAFMDDKGVVSNQTWRQSVSDVVLLAEFPKYVWTSDETFRADIVVANYSNRNFDGGLVWSITDQSGTMLAQGLLKDALTLGGLTDSGTIDFELESVETAQEIFLNIRIPGTEYSNQYPLWVYAPIPENKIDHREITVAEALNTTVFDALEQGKSVLLFPDATKPGNKTLDGLFPPDFWNYEMFKGISESNNKPYSPGTLGLLTDPEHPLFNTFPTDFHSNWQWFSIVKASHPMILDDTDSSYRPIVQVIDNLQRNHKLGLIFEFKVGDGKLLVSMADLRTLSDKPEAVQLYKSIVEYMKSQDFNPETKLSTDELTKLLD